MRRKEEMQINFNVLRIRKEVRRGLLKLLETLQSEDVDKIEEALIAKGISMVASHYTDKEIPEVVSKAAAKEIVKCLNKINLKLQNRLSE